MARRILLATLLAGLLVPTAAPAVLSQQGDVVVSFDGDLAPATLPRTDPAPISIGVAGTVKSAKKGGDIPQLQTISVAINDAGRLYDKGLPICKVGSIQPATESNARETCGASIVGHGHVTVEAHVPTQPPFSVDATLLAFNGPVVHGHKEILAQVYARSPPGAFVLPFRISHHAGLFGTVMSTRLPQGTSSWAYLASFEMTLHRIYRYAGAERSFVSAACSAPAGFPGAVFPFAKATYGFAGGRKMRATVVRSCKVR
ncbi:MAG TPA: hypothetical protein VHE08_01465 [Solirubrobacterales bacterium]|nr:hypothetical protein [Solirubrobacterales bacterium]